MTRLSAARSPLLLVLFAAVSMPAALAQAPKYSYRAGGTHFGVAALDANSVMVTRDGGGGLWSDNGGLSWSESDLPDAVRGQLRHIFILDGENSWTVGDGGHVLHSSDLGVNWTHVNSTSPVLDRLNAPAKLYDIWMHDTDHGMCVGERGTLAITSNGGSTWSSVTLPTGFYDPLSSDPIVNVPGDIYRIHWYDAENVLLVADRGRVIESDDGGQTWSSWRIAHYCDHDPDGNVELWDLAVEGEVTWIVGGHVFNDGFAFRRATLGGTWMHIDRIAPIDADTMTVLTDPLGGGWATFYGVAPIGNNQVVAVAYGSGILEYSGSGSGTLDTVDRCQNTNTPVPTTDPTWIQVATPAYTGQGAAPSRPPLSAIFTLGSTNRWITGSFGKILRWDDNLADWLQCGTPPDGQHRFRGADQIDAQTIVVAAQGHRILKSTDSGRSFDTAYVGASNDEDMQLVAMSRKPSSGIGLAFGTDHHCARSTDSGDSWIEMDVHPHIVKRSLAFGGATDIAYVGGPNGYLFRTDASDLDTNGDLTWTAVTLPVAEHVNGLAFVDEDTGYAVTEDMTAWFTSNGGSSWTQVQFLTSPSSTQALNAVATFGDGSKAVAVGNAGVVMVRNGARFQYVDLSGVIGATVLNDVAIAGGGTRIIAVGNDGVIAEFSGSSFADALDPQNWSAPKSKGSSAPFIAVRLDDVDHGFVFGRQGLVVEYE